MVRSPVLHLLLGIASLVLASCDAQPDTAGGAECNLHVGWDPYEPYSYSDGSAIPVGYDIEVITKIAGMLGCSLKFTELPWSEVLVALQKGDVDIAVGTGYKPGRAEWSWYTESYRDEVIGLMVRAGTAAEFSGNTFDEVFERGLVFGKTTDDTYDASMEALFAKFESQLQPRVSEEENVRRLLDETIDGFLVEVFVGAAIASRLSVTDAVEYHPLSLAAGAYRLQLSKQTVTAERIAEINAAIQQLAYSGWFAERLDSYGIQAGESRR